MKFVKTLLCIACTGVILLTPLAYTEVYAADASSSEAGSGEFTAEAGEFPNTNAPKLYDPTTASSGAQTPVLGEGQVQGNAVVNIEEYESAVIQDERSSLFDGILFSLGGVVFFYASLLILAYGLDRINMIPKLSILKIVTFGKYTSYSVGIVEFIGKDLVLMVFGILLASGVVKKLISLVLIAFFNLIN